MLRTIAGAALLLCLCSANSCLDNDGKEVKWSFTYKMPNGYQNAYVDSNSPSASKDGLSLFERNLDDTNNPPALIKTLLALEDDSWVTERLNNATRRSSSGSNSYLLYNDEPDSGPASSTLGHTKGVLHVGSDGGFWLVHSTPKWPLSTTVKNFYFPDSETKFGQTFLCITLSKSDIDDVAGQLVVNQPNVYYNGLTSSETGDHPKLQDVLDKNWPRDPTNTTAKFAGGFTSYAKNRQWGGDLYGDMVAPGLGSDLLVESWIRGEACGNFCKPKYEYQVTDVKELKAGDVTWTESQDHAKWAVALDTSNVACIGDINRMTSQEKRGGGTVCFESAALANALYNSITSSDSC